jgi:prephenate dehydrogenase
MTKPLIGKLAIFGVGLIGGSFALALREAGAVGEIVGVGRSAENLRAALDLRVIDRIAADAADALSGTDLVLLAIPVGQMAAVMRQIAPYLSPETAITDAGSTKQDVVALARSELAAHLAAFVPGHPIAGAENSGVTAARTDLFRNRNTVLTPLPENAPAAVQKIAAAWRLCGAQVAQMSAAEHDAIFAAVSHLPHLLAFALVDDIAAKPNAAELFRYAASGFRDFTRIAASSPEMWRDIFLANRTALLSELGAYQEQLARLRAMLENSNGAALEQVFQQARQARRQWASDRNL